MTTISDVHGEGEQSISAESYALEHTPTWAVAVVCIVFIALSLLMQRGLQRLGNWLLSSHKKSLYEALEKMKEELMLLGFISLLLTAAQNPVSRLCMPASWANQMLPCHFQTLQSSFEAQPPLAPAAAAAIHNLVAHRSTLQSSGHAEQPDVRRRHSLSFPSRDTPRRKLSGAASPNFCPKGRVPLMSTESLHQLHIFIFVMAVVHVFYSCFTMLFGFTQLRNWRKWEEETNVDNYNYTDEIKKSFNEEAFRKMPFRKMGLGSLRRQSTFVTSRTMTPWAATTCGIWFNSFFRQFGKSVAKSDYLTLRLGFIKNHNAPMHLNFHKYIMNSLEDDLKTVIGISGYLWVFVIFFMILNVHGWYAYFWMSFIPVLINLVIGAKLQHIITQLALETAHAHGLAAAPIKPRDELFWFNNPHLLLYLIHFVLFQNAFELAFCIWLVTTFGFNSCFFAKHGFIISRVIVGIFAQVLCSYSTLPLYALVSQMGSHYKKAIFADPVSTAMTDWRNKAKANVRQRRLSTELEHGTDAEGSSHSHSHCRTHGHEHEHGHDHEHRHHHHFQSSAVVASDGQTISQTHHDTSCVTHPVDDAKPRTEGTKSDLVTSSATGVCGQCERLSLTLHMDVAESCDGNTSEQNDTNQGSACPPKSQLPGSARTNAVYVKISSEETNGGFPRWSLECGDCKSFRALTVESSLVKNEENSQVGPTVHEGEGPKSPRVEGVRVQSKRKSVFLKMSRAETPKVPNPSKGPCLDRMRRLPSREIREIRSAEAMHGLEPFRPDLDIPELMMCTTLLNDHREVVEFTKATSTRAAESASSHSILPDAPVTNQEVKLETSNSSLGTETSATSIGTNTTPGHIPMETIQLGKLGSFSAGLRSAQFSGGGSEVSNEVAVREKPATEHRNPTVATAEELPGDKE